MLRNPEMRTCVAISFGAVAGALSRYYLTSWFTQRFGTSFPYGTFFINLTGCFAMGFFMTLAWERIVSVPPEVRLLVATGFLGSYTTFSTYGLETIALLRDAHRNGYGHSPSGSDSVLNQLVPAVIYWAGSALLGVISVQLGVMLARVTFSHR
jgi:CrcB protein